MELQFQHHHVLTFCDQNKKNFSHILFKFFKRDERNRRKVDGDSEVAELDDEECAELDDEEDYEESDDEEDYEESDDEDSNDEEDYEGSDDEESNDGKDYEESDDEESNDEKDNEESDDEDDYPKFNEEENYPKCCVCFRIVYKGPVYFCEKCDDIWVHKFCASFPPEIRAHPLHLQHHHSLILDMLLESRYYLYICHCCGDMIRTPIYYGCSECELMLDLKCALSPDNDDLQQIRALLSPDTKTQISHDTHPHTLFLFNPKSVKISDFSSNTCKLCARELLDLTYRCLSCEFYLHKKCVEISQQECEVQHSCHSHHPVSIEYGCQEFICDQCRDLCSGSFMASCKECGFKFDFKCAFLRDTKCALSPHKDDLQITPLVSPDTKTKISHDSHRHTLFLVHSRSRTKWTTWTCSLCEREIVGLGYCCIHCDFYLHKRCVEITQQECEVQHYCHSHHPVSIQYCDYNPKKFICDQCKDLCSGIFMASCKKCDFKFDLKCAFLTDATTQRSIGDEVKTQIRYFNHDLHLLSFFNCTNDLDLECRGCSLRLSGPCYGCVECSVYLHKSCVELPQLIQHPYHPFHNLFLKDFKQSKCKACRRRPRGLSYRCYWCPSFCLDAQCAINNLGVISALKNKEYHQHDLYYFVPPELTEFKCIICSKDRQGPLYICLECKAYFHMECIGIPKEVKHDSHNHPLTLMDPLSEDDIDESKDQYYCYTCENKRNPRYHAYSCQQCVKTGHIFTAHIECVLSTELNEIELNQVIKEDDEEDNNLENFPDLCELSISPRCMRQLLMKDKFNDHILNYIEDTHSFSCYLCNELVEGSCYECSFCEIHLHKECAKLPFKIKHNLHEHPLSIQGGEFLKRFICDGCQVYHKRDMCYQCEECRFSLDRMCAQGIPSIGNCLRKLNDNGSKVGFSHFSHNHKLRFAFIPEKLWIVCSGCRLQILGPTYCCYACSFFLHESCFDELKPQYSQHPFHIQHPLHFKFEEVLCKVCTIDSDIGYQCAECNFALDIKCVNYLTSSLQHKCHKHKLFCFVDEDINDRRCEHCDQKCNAIFYRCLDCEVNLHIECMSIPKNIKSVCHVHPLTLMDSINEEGQDEYYCHACENLRNPKHVAYCCKKCYYTAHIGCVLDEEDGEIEIL